MGFYKKTVLLSNNSNYEKGMAILTIEQNNGGVFGSIKGFDIPNSKSMVLGISVDGLPVIKQNVIFSNGNIFNFKLSNDFEINGKIGCVLADITAEMVNVLVWGTNGAQAQYKEDIIKILNRDLKQNTKVDTYKLQEKHEIKPELFEMDDEEVEKQIDDEVKPVLEEGDDFLSLIGEQIDELFGRYPLYDRLSELIENSKWIKVDYENNGKEYILGLISENDEVKYICYGVPGTYENNPPLEIMPYSQWLMVDEDEGYWVMYQDAKTGDSVLINNENIV